MASAESCPDETVEIGQRLALGGTASEGFCTRLVSAALRSLSRAARSVPSWPAAPRRSRSPGAGNDDLHRDLHGLGQRRGGGPNVAVIVASSVLFSGVGGSGVRVMVSVVDWPTASETGARPVSVRPAEAWRTA